jgi:hypothetical protein
MTDFMSSSNARDFSGANAMRVVVFVATSAIVFVGYWLMLPRIQSLIIPSISGGDKGPWLVRPDLGFHFGAAAAMAGVTVPVLTWPLDQIWKREDGTLGTRYDPLQKIPAARGILLVKAFFLLAVYVTGLVFYLFSWTLIGPGGIEQRLPWTTRKHSYQDIVWLETIPDGERSNSIAQDGPWYLVRLKDGQSITLSHENEGVTAEELRAMTTYIADRSGIRWARKNDSRRD